MTPASSPPSTDVADARCGRVLLAVALLSGLGLMAPLWSAGPLVLDEHCSYWIVAGPSGGSICTRSLEYAATPPLSSWLQRASLAVLGKSEFAFRLPSAVYYLAAIGVTFLIGRTLDSRAAGGLAALLVAWHPEALDQVRLARPYGLLLLLSALLLWGAATWWQSPVSRVGPVVTVLSAAALLWTHYVAALLVATVGCVLLMAPPPQPEVRRLSRVRVLLAGILIAVSAIPLAPAVLRMMEWSPFLNYRAQTPRWTDLVGPVWCVAAPLALVLALWPIRRDQSTRLNRARLIFVTAGWGLLPLLLLAFLARGHMTSLADPRYRVPFVVGGSFFIAQLVQWRGPGRWWGAGACALMIGAAWWFAGLRPWDPGRLSDPLAADWKSLAERIERDGRPGEPVFVQSGLIESSLVPVLYDDETFLEYVACRASRFYLESDHPRIGLPFLWDDQTGVTDAFRARLRALTASGQDSFWLACALDTDLNRGSCEGLQTLAAQAGYQVIAEEKYPQTLLQRYGLAGTVPPTAANAAEFKVPDAE